MNTLTRALGAGEKFLRPISPRAVLRALHRVGCAKRNRWRQVATPLNTELAEAVEVDAVVEVVKVVAEVGAAKITQIELVTMMQILPKRRQKKKTQTLRHWRIESQHQPVGHPATIAPGIMMRLWIWTPTQVEKRVVTTDISSILTPVVKIIPPLLPLTHPVQTLQRLPVMYPLLVPTQPNWP